MIEDQLKLAKLACRQMQKVDKYTKMNALDAVSYTHLDVYKRQDEHSEDAMLAHTHGQPATPTTIGKEFKVYAYRFLSSIENIESIKIKAKFNGATGNYLSLIHIC